jgi:hypothetical protein
VRTAAARPVAIAPRLPRRQVTLAIAVLLALIFSKYFYLASLSTYYTFFLMERFGISAQDAQIHLFLFLGSVALGTLVGGPVGDRFGRKYVIWVSILGVLPFTLLLPHVDLFWTSVLSVVIGLILSSAFSAILVYATGQRRHGRGPVLRLRLRHGRPRRGAARRARRCQRHRIRLSAVRVPAGNRPAHGFPAEPASPRGARRGLTS